MAKRYILNLTDDERDGLEQVVASRSSALKRQRAAILLLADNDVSTDVEIAEEIGIGVATVERVRKRCALEGVGAALERKKQALPSRERALDGRAEAHLIQLACTKPPAGRARWTLRLLAVKMVELEIVETVSLSTVHRGLKKTS